MRAPVVALGLLLFVVPATAAVLHVCPDGSGEYPHLRAAVEAAKSGDEIELCDGLLVGLNNVDIDVGAKDLTFRSIHGRDATLVENDIVDAWGEHEPHRAFVLGVATHTSIEGITLSNFWVPGGEDGGAIYAPGAFVTLIGVRIQGRVSGDRQGGQRGAGLFLESGSLHAEDCEFISNKAVAEGGAIFAAGSWITLDRCYFFGNGGCFGNRGAIRLDGGAITDCVFEHNSASMCQGNPGGRCIVATGRQISVRRCRFTENVDISGGCAAVLTGSEVVVEDCLIEGGHGEVRGELAMFGGTARLWRTTFRDNDTAWGGAAISGAGAVILEHCVFTNNRSLYGIYNDGEGAIAMYGPSALTASYCSFVHNAMNGGAAITLQSGASLSVDHTIIAFGGAADWTFGAIHCAGPLETLSVECSDIYGNGGGDWIGCIADQEGMAGNFSLDPLFCNAESGDFAVREDSPCAPGATTCRAVGALGVGCQSVSIRGDTWGRLKAAFR